MRRSMAWWGPQLCARSPCAPQALCFRWDKPVASGNASSAIRCYPLQRCATLMINSPPAASWGWLTSSAFASIIS